MFSLHSEINWTELKEYFFPESCLHLKTAIAGSCKCFLVFSCVATSFRAARLDSTRLCFALLCSALSVLPCLPCCRNCNLLKLLLLLRVFVKISQLSFNPGSQSVHYKTFSWPFGELRCQLPRGSPLSHTIPQSKRRGEGRGNPSPVPDTLKFSCIYSFHFV